MRDLLTCIYMATLNNGACHAFMTHDPRVDAVFLFPGQDSASLEVLTPYLPVGISYYLMQAVSDGKRLYSREASYETLVRSRAGEVYSLMVRLERVLGKGTLLEHMEGYPARLVMKNLRTLRIPESQVCREVLGALRGRILFREELETALAENTGDTALRNRNLNDILQVLALQGQVEVMPALGFSGPVTVTCFRCGSKTDLRSSFWGPGFSGGGGKVFRADCPVCGFPSIFCEQCNTLGDSRLCRGLYAAPGESLSRSGLGSQPESMLNPQPGRMLNPQPESMLNPQLRGMQRIQPRGVPPLTSAQRAASDELAAFASGLPVLPADNGQTKTISKTARSGKFLLGKPKTNIKECLVWAVCGAGKTEVVFGAIAEVLNRGGRVLYAIPRRDVVRELAPRLQDAFREVELLASYGGSAGKYRASRLVTATTHQVIRYYRNFDLVILDEVDAYPYQGSDMLRMAVQRAVKPGGGTIYLTATPDRRMLADTRSGVTGLVTIPARYHGYPVPEPRLEKAALYTSKGRNGREVNREIVNLLLRWLSDPGRQAFIFLPTVTIVEEYGPLLAEALLAAVRRNGHTAYTGYRTVFQNDLLRFSHARDAQRDRKRDDFKKGKFPLFVTTTIMERGITVKKANVLVLEADREQVFDEGTLIQMAGRAGRSAEYPEGEVIFAGKTINDAMRNARKKIIFLNETARGQGYLKPGL